MEAKQQAGGFFGGAATDNLCSKCYKNQQLLDVVAFDNAVMSGLGSLTITPTEAQHDVGAAEGEEEMPVKAAASTKNRCKVCQKKVGLLGFVCRCGATYCRVHRHAGAHGCDFDYKAAGREQIARQNPLVVAPKILKI